MKTTNRAVIYAVKESPVLVAYGYELHRGRSRAGYANQIEFTEWDPVAVVEGIEGTIRYGAHEVLLGKAEGVSILWAAPGVLDSYPVLVAEAEAASKSLTEWVRGRPKQGQVWRADG